jgi:hypothetical protein
MDIKKLRRLISEEIKIILEDFSFDNSQKMYEPTSEVIATAQRGLSAIANNNLTQHGGNEGSGEQKAKSILSKEPLNHSMLKRMKAFYDENKSEVRKERSLGKNINNSALIQTWELWGGDAGMNWVNKQIDHLNNRNLSRKDLRRSSGIEKTSTLMDPTNTRIHR